ncbi:MAG: 4'-phosphopantetheinyl transferase family protein [Elainellaceae cyanobacterium]
MPLVPGAIHIWKAPLNLAPFYIHQRAGLLSADEIERAHRLRQPARHSFVAARSTLRLILSQYLRCHPEDICFTYSDRGKPFLKRANPDQCSLQFNLSHSQGLAVYAIATQGAIGIDIECIRTVPALTRLARRYFSPQECASLEPLSGLPQQRRFFELWTQKEAYAKATGEGIYRLATLKPPPTWFTSRLQIAPGYVAAVTASALVHDLHLFYWAGC